MHPAAKVVPVLAALLLAACSTLDYPDEPAYQRARQARALEVPPDLDSPSSSGGVPEVVAAEATAEDLEGFQKFKQFEQWEEFEQYRQWKAQSSSDEQLDFQAFLEARRAMREGNENGAGVSLDNNFDQSRDIRIAGADAESSWQYVDTALAAMNAQIINRNADKYSFDLALPELQESSLFRPNADRFTLQLGRDKQDMIVALVDRRGSRVTTQPAAQFMDRLAGQIRLAKVRLDLENRVTTASEKAGSVRTTDQGHLALDFSDPALRIWDRLDYVIDQVGFTVLERDRDGQTFRVRYITDDQIKPERTGLAKLAFWKDDEGIPEGADLYTVRVAETDSGSTVSVVNNVGEASETSDTILELLREKL